MKKTLIIFFFFLAISINSFSQNVYYTNAQIKDTISKYSNIFEAFSKLDINKISIEEFRQDSFLMSKSYDLFEKKYSIQLAFRNYKFNELKNINTNKQWQKNEIDLFLRRNKTLSDKQINIFIDSISKNELLFKKYLDSSFNYKFTNDSILFFNNKNWQTDSRYIIFHSKLMTQRSYDTIRAYYDRHYKNSLAFYEPVLIALINMGDPEVLGKYDSVLTEKINNKTLTWNDYTHIHDFDVPFMYQTYARLLFYDEIVDGYQLNVFITDYNFPVIYYEVQDSVLKKIELKKDKNGNKKYKFVLPIEEIAKYFLGFAEYWEEKEQLNIKLLYKTD